MQTSNQSISECITVAFVVVLLTETLIVSGCAAMSTVASTCLRSGQAYRPAPVVAFPPTRLGNTGAARPGSTPL